MMRSLMVLAVAALAALAAYPTPASAGEIALRFQWGTSKTYAGHFHDIVRFGGAQEGTLTGGAWARLSSAERVNEDRLAVMLEDPERPIEGFGSIGCYRACHSDMNAMPGSPRDTRHYFEPRSGEPTGSFAADMWHWRGGRSGPMGLAEDAWVATAEQGTGAQGRAKDAGTSPTDWLTGAGDRFHADQNWGGAIAWKGIALPRFVFDPAKASSGSYFLGYEGEPFTSVANLFALRDASYRSQLVVYQDYSFDPVDKVNAIDVQYLLFKAGAIAKPAYGGDWEAFWAARLPHVATAEDAADELDAILAEMSNGVMVTRNVGFIYSSSAHDVRSRYDFDYDTEARAWTLTLRRSLDTGNSDDVDLGGLLSGVRYNMAIAVHDVGLGDNSHHITRPLTLGRDGADIGVQRVADVGRVDWTAVAPTSVSAYQPGNVPFEFLVDPASHPGSGGVSAGMGCTSGFCHAGGDLPELSMSHVPTRAADPIDLSVRAVMSAESTATTITITAPSVVEYRGTATLRGRLRDMAGRALPGKPVAVQSSGNGTTGWKTIKTVSSATGSYAATVTPSRATFYRMRFTGDLEHSVSTSAKLKVTPKVLLSRPLGPQVTTRGVRFTSSGALKPRHPAGTMPVRIERWRYEGTKWVRYPSVSATVSDYSTYSKYSAKVALPKRGVWRIRAYHPADSAYASTYSAWRYIGAW